MSAEPIDEVTFARLRFLASAAVAALSQPSPRGGFSEREIPEAFPSDVNPTLLRDFLRHTIAVLEIVPDHQALVTQVREALAEANGDK